MYRSKKETLSVGKVEVLPSKCVALTSKKVYTSRKTSLVENA
jgi:hypothetical protein